MIDYTKKIYEELSGIRKELKGIRKAVEEGSLDLQFEVQGFQRELSYCTLEDLRKMLKNGMVLETRNGDRWMWYEGKAIGTSTYIELDSHLQDVYGNHPFDVKRVFDVGEAWNLDDILIDIGEVIWKSEAEGIDS